MIEWSNSEKIYAHLKRDVSGSYASRDKEGRRKERRNARTGPLTRAGIAGMDHVKMIDWSEDEAEEIDRRS